MIGKVKKWLGIEGVKLELVLPVEVQTKKGQGMVEGIVRFQSMHPQTITHLELRMVERYSRGRRKEKLTDEYTLATIALDQYIAVIPDQVVEVPFQLPFELIHSDMQAFGNKNPLSRGLVSAIKWVEGVQSLYRIEAEAKVDGVALSPFDKKAIVIK